VAKRKKDGIDPYDNTFIEETTPRQAYQVCGKDYFRTMYKEGTNEHKVLPIPGVGCVLSVNGELVYLPGVRFVDGELVK